MFWKNGLAVGHTDVPTLQIEFRGLTSCDYDIYRILSSLIETVETTNKIDTFAIHLNCL